MEKVKGGAFLVARKLFESEIWTNKPDSWTKIWVYILGNVNHQDNEKFKKGEGFFRPKREIPLISSSISTDIFKKFLNFARKNDMISTRRSTRGIIIKVLNYPKYQTLESYRGTRVSTELGTNQAPERHQTSTTINKNDKELKNDKNITTSEPSSQINRLIDFFRPINASYKKFYANKTQRGALKRLIGLFGEEMIIKVLNILPKTNGMSYAPVITTPLQLEDKWSALEAFVKKEKSKLPSVAVIKNE